MTNRAAAMRYARALLDVCEREGELERVEQEVSGFVATMNEHPLLHESLMSPAVPPAPKRALVGTLLARGGDFSPITVRLLTLLTDRGRLSLLPEILEVYGDRLMDHRGIVRARITTASPLPTDRVREIGERLKAATGKQVSLETGVDPSVLGGVVTQIGSTVWDGSIARHLARLKQQFLGEA